MRFTVSEKQELIHMVVQSDLGINRTLREIGLNKSTFYKYHKAYSDFGVEGLEPYSRSVRRQWNSIPQEQKNLVVELALERPELSSRELAYHLTDEQQIFISESSVYRILKNRGLLRPLHMFSYLREMSLPTKPSSYIKCGKQTSPTLKSWVGVGIS